MDLFKGLCAFASSQLKKFQSDQAPFRSCVSRSPLSKPAFILFLLTVLFSGSSHATEIQRLSLFLESSEELIELRQYPSPHSTIDSTRYWTEENNISQEENEWLWVLENQSAEAITNARVTGYLDVDFNSDINTFFNEGAEFLSLTSEDPGNVPLDRWEVGEPGYWSGDILYRAVKGDLANSKSIVGENAEDIALAMSALVPEWKAGHQLVVRAKMAPSGNHGIRQTDANSGSSIVFSMNISTGSNIIENTNSGNSGNGGNSGSHNNGGVNADHAHHLPAGSAWSWIILTLGLVLLGARKLKNQTVALVLLAFVLLIPSEQSFAIFENGDFEAQSIDHWEHFYSDNKGLHGEPPYTLKDIRYGGTGQSLIDYKGHGFDENAPNITLPRQGNYTLKLNDEHGGAHLNAISQIGKITENDRDDVDGKLHIRFSYAAVLSDPGHSPSIQPYFHVQLLDKTSNKVLYDDFAYSNQPGRVFNRVNNTSGLWLATPFIDVDIVVPEDSLGHDIEIQVTRADCAAGGHGGYVYVDAFGSSVIPPQSACLNNLVARSKPGKIQLTWADTGALSYAVYRSPSFVGPYQKLGETDSRYSTWLDENVLSMHKYYYRVSPLDEDGNEICTSGEIVGQAPAVWELHAPRTDPIRFLSNPPTDHNLHDEYSYQPEILPEDDVELSLNHAPVGMSLDDATGIITWQPESAGVYRVNLVAETISGRVANQAFSITVTDNNHAPVIENDLPESILAGSTFEEQIIAHDEDGDEIFYSVSSQALGVSISKEGLFKWLKPQAGTYPITIIVTDNKGGKSSKTFLVKIESHPEFTSLPIKNVQLGLNYNYKAKAVDLDGDTVMYTLRKKTEGMSINEFTGMVSWQPSDTGNYQIEIIASDDKGNSGIQNYFLKVTTSPNSNPSITSTPEIYLSCPKDYNYQPIASDPDQDSLVWALLSAPPGMEINSYTGRIEWRPLVWSNEEHWVELQLDDQRGGIDTQQFIVRTECHQNDMPLNFGHPPSTVLAGNEYRFGISSTDINGDELEFSLIKAPEGMAIKSNFISWHTSVDDLGLYEIEATVTDGKSVVSKEWTIHVIPGHYNSPPTINSTPALSAEAGELYIYKVNPHDAEGDAVIVTVDSALAHGITVNTNNEVIWQVPEAISGSFPVTIIATDEQGAFNSQQYAIGVGVPDNTPPRFTSQPSPTISSGKPYTYVASAYDQDGDELVFDLVSGPEGMALEDSSISWQVPNNYNGSEIIKLTVADGKGGTSTQEFRVATNGEGNRPPYFRSNPKVNMKSGELYTSKMPATDPNADALSYYLRESPEQMTVDNNGLIEWQSPSDFNGLMPVVLRATDEKGAYVEVSYFISVIGVGNSAPRITSRPSGSATVGQEYRYTIFHNDVENHAVQISIPQAPAGANLTDGNKLYWTPTIEQLGENTFSILLTDSEGGKTTQDFTVFVINTTNRFPYFTSTPLIRAKQGIVYSYATNVQDADGDSIFYSLVGEPSGMEVSSKGVVTWADPVEGTYPITIKASDGRGGSETQSYQLSVSFGNSTPIIISIPITSVPIGQTYAYQVHAEDPDDDFLNYRLIGGSNEITISDTGLVEWEPTGERTYNLTVVVSDGIDEFEQSYSVRSFADSQKPLDVSVEWTKQFGQPGEALTFNILPSGGAPPYRVRLNDGTWKDLEGFTYTFIAESLGKKNISVYLYDADNTQKKLTIWYSVTDGSDTVEPHVNITSPGSSDTGEVNTVTTISEVLGTATDANFADYQLLISPSGQANWSELVSSNQPVAEGILGSINTQTMANGLYDIRLIARDLSGNIAQAGITIAVSGQQKTAPLQLTFKDMELDVEGFPLTVYRSYSSLKRHTSADFGYGWTIGFQSMEVQTNGVLGRGWNLEEAGSGFNSQLCVRPSGSRVASILLPSGELEQFYLKALNECVPVIHWTGNTDIEFIPKSTNKSGATLEAVNYGQLRIVNGELFDMNTLATFSPSLYRLTLRDGTEYIFENDFGLRQVVDTSGNQLSFSKRGVTHSDGPTLYFERDNDNRIVRIAASNGETVKYQYSNDGDLVSYTAQGGEVSRFDYDNHLLTDYTDPLGLRQLNVVYDNHGRVIQQRDALSSNATVDTDNEQSILTTKDRNGSTHKYQFDDRGNVTRYEDPQGGVTQYEYDENDNEIKVIDSLNRVTEREFDQWGNIIKETTPDGKTITTEYNDSGEVTKISESEHQVTEYEYSGTGQVKQITLPGGSSINIDYTAKGSLSLLEDAVGNKIQIDYGTINNTTKKISETDKNGYKTYFDYDSLGRLSGERRNIRLAPDQGAVELQTSKTLDAAGNQISSTDQLGNKTLYLYNAAGQLVEERNPLGYLTRHTYNQRGEKTRTDYPDGTFETWQYDNNGNVERYCPEAQVNNCILTGYDKLNRPVTVKDGNGHLVTTVYDLAGQVSEIIDARENKTVYEYDSVGRQTRQIDALLGETTYKYNLNGEREESKDPNGNTTRYVYSEAGYLTEEILPSGASHSMDYDLLGRLKSKTDAEENTVFYDYDAVGQLVSVTDAHNKETAYIWNERGDLLSQTDAKSQTTQFTYTATGLRHQRILPDDAFESYRYDAAGNLLEHTDFNGAAIRYERNKVGNITREFHPVHRLDYQYSGSRLSSVVLDSERGTVSVDYQYDTGGQFSRVQQRINGGMGTSQNSYLYYDWNANGFRNSLRLGGSTSAPTMEYEYDKLDRLTKIIAPSGEATTFGYDANGNRTEVVRANGTTSTFEYDVDNRLLGVTHKRLDASVLADFQYTLDNNGRRIKVEETLNGSERTVDYAYDALGRLILEQITQSGTTTATHYTYDAVGNRLAKDRDGTVTTYTYDNRDRLLTETTHGEVTAYHWDDNGNLLAKQSPGSHWHYTWTTDNTLIEATDGSVTVQYLYDGDGRRLKRLVTNGTDTLETQYIVDIARPYSEVAIEKTRLNHNAWTETVNIHTPGGFGDMVMTFKEGEATYYYGDAQGSTRLLADASATVSETLTFDAFGNRLSGTTSASHQYTGEMFDEVTGFVHLRAREYDPQIGRFISMDKWEGDVINPLTKNKYLYSIADPINNKDPSGYMTMVGVNVGISMASIGAIVNLSGVAGVLYATHDSSPRPTIWDAIVMMQISHQVPAEAHVAMEEAAAKAGNKSYKSDERHHTIPKYLCGNDRQKPLVLVTYQQHQVIHAGLSTVEIFIESIGDSIQFGRRRSSTIETLGRHDEGRAAIAAAIYTFYILTGTGNFKSPEGIQTIMQGFNQAKGPFIGGESWCAM